MKKRLITLASLLFLFSSCSESDTASPLAPSLDKETTAESRATYSWTKGVVGWPFYFNGMSSTSYFKGSGVPYSGTSITKVEWKWNDLPSGTQKVVLSYKRPYSSTVIKEFPITDKNIGETNFFNGESAKGTINMTFKSIDGNYPLRPTLKDSIKVHYTY